LAWLADYTFPVAQDKLFTSSKSHGIKISGKITMTTENIIFIEETIVILLLIASAVAVTSRSLRMPIHSGTGYHIIESAACGVCTVNYYIAACAAAGV
jgi:hypothetical protein